MQTYHAEMGRTMDLLFLDEDLSVGRLNPLLSKANVGGTGNPNRRFFLWGILHVSSENRGTVAGGFLLCLVLQGPL